MIKAKFLNRKPQHKYEWAKQSVCTCDNQKQSVHRHYWDAKRAVAFAVSAKEFGIFLMNCGMSETENGINPMW
jgi:hypothetical protein